VAISKKQKLAEYKTKKQCPPNPTYVGWRMLFDSVEERKSWETEQKKIAIAKKRAERNEQK